MVRVVAGATWCMKAARLQEKIWHPAYFEQ